jgi:uncharacterized membrane protein YgaE (UPF0421/DUF939 family)
MSKVEPETLIETVRSLRIEVKIYKEYNEKMMREQNQIIAQMMKNLNKLHRGENNGSNSRHKEECIHHERRDNQKISSHSISASRNHIHHSPPYLARKLYASKDSMSSLEVSHVSH